MELFSQKKRTSKDTKTSIAYSPCREVSSLFSHAYIVATVGISEQTTQMFCPEAEKSARFVLVLLRWYCRGSDPRRHPHRNEVVTMFVSSGFLIMTPPKFLLSRLKCTRYPMLSTISRFSSQSFR